MPWLLWNFDKQTYTQRELVVIDSSEQPLEVANRPGVRVIRAAKGTNVPTKRNLALDRAMGSVIAWFDDDDWQHPERLALLVRALSGDTVIAGGRHSWFVDVAAGRAVSYRAGRGVIFNGAALSAEAARTVRFDPRRHRGSDTVWMAALAKRLRTGIRDIGDTPLSLWLCHQQNLSNPAKRRRFPEPLDRLRATVGDAAWADTEEQLDRLRERLGSAPKPVAVVAVPTQPLPLAKPPPVSAMIKATVLDAPYLGVMVPHMLQQMRHPLADRYIVVDRRPEFTGKYAGRPRTTRAELDRVLDQLVARGAVDRIVEVDDSRERVADTMRRYFGSDDVPTHASSGGPIHPRLTRRPAWSEPGRRGRWTMIWTSQGRSLRWARRLLGIALAAACAIAVVPSCNPTPEACNFTDCGPDEARLIDLQTGQDVCVPVLDPGEACDTNITSVCAQGHACINGTCQPAPVFSEFCGIFGEGQCAYSFGTGQPLFCGCPPTSGPFADNPFFRLCGLYASINNPCDSNAADPICAPCEPGLQCLDGYCSKLCTTDDDCPCGANGQPTTTCSTVPEGEQVDTLRCIRCQSLGDRCNKSNRPCCDDGESCGPANVCCRVHDAECSTAGDCCDPTGVCLDGLCKPCQQLGQACTTNAACCGGLTCRGGVCAEPCLSGSCTVPDAQGECKAGTWQCGRLTNTCEPNTGPTAEVCDGKDNDCDGQTDEGIPSAPCDDATVSGCQSGFTVKGMSECVNGQVRCEARKCNTNDPNDTDCYCTSCGAGVGGNGKPCGECGATPCTPGVTACIPSYACTSSPGGPPPPATCQQDTVSCSVFPTCWTPDDVKLPPNHCYNP